MCVAGVRSHYYILTHSLSRSLTLCFCITSQDDIENFLPSLTAQDGGQLLGLSGLDIQYPDTASLSLADLDLQLDGVERDLKQLNSSLTVMRRSYCTLLEKRIALACANQFFGHHPEVARSDYNSSTDLLLPVSVPNRIGALIGVLPRSAVAQFEVVIWRVARGNAFFEQVEVQEPLPTAERDSPTMLKNAFIIFYQGTTILTRLQKVCDAWGANTFPCSSSAEERRIAIDTVSSEVTDLVSVIRRSEERRFQVRAMM